MTQSLLINKLGQPPGRVAVPDYEGPNAAFTAGPKAGKATLDVIRATLKSGHITKISPNAKSIMWGYSGGAIPTQFAAQLQPHYAPDLSDSLLSASSGGIIANLSSTLTTMDNSKYSGLGLSGLKEFLQEYPDIAKYVKNHLVSDKEDKFHKASTLCLEPLEDEFKNDAIFSYLDNGHDILNDESVKPIFLKNIMDEDTPKVPQFLYHSEKDEVFLIDSVDAFVKKYCDDGGRIQFHEDLESSHAILFLTGSPDAL